MIPPSQTLTFRVATHPQRYHNLTLAALSCVSDHCRRLSLPCPTLQQCFGWCNAELCAALVIVVSHVSFNEKQRNTGPCLRLMTIAG